MNPGDLPPDRMLNLTVAWIEERLTDEEARMKWENGLAEARSGTAPAAASADDGFGAYMAAHAGLGR